MITRLYSLHEIPPSKSSQLSHKIWKETVEKLILDFVPMYHPSADNAACSSKMSSYMMAHSTYNMCNFSQMEAHLADDCWKAENKEAACAFKPIKNVWAES